MAVKRTPPIAVKGQFKLKTPWEVVEDRTYQCSAVRSFPELAEKNIDTFAMVYEPMSLSREVYERDRLAGANIITLMSDLHPVIHVPDTYIESFPDMSGMRYDHMVISASLGAVPNYLDLTFAKQQVLNVIKDVVGIESVVEVHSAPTTKFITIDQHTALEVSRKVAIKNITTDHGVAKDLKEKNEELVRRVKILEKIIKDNGLLD